MRTAVLRSGPSEKSPLVRRPIMTTWKKARGRFEWMWGDYTIRRAKSAMWGGVLEYRLHLHEQYIGAAGSLEQAKLLVEMTEADRQQRKGVRP